MGKAVPRFLIRLIGLLALLVIVILLIRVIGALPASDAVVTAAVLYSTVRDMTAGMFLLVLSVLCLEVGR